jgi:hypothetical protein
MCRPWVVWLLCGVLPAAAQADVTMTVNAGVGGTVRSGCMAPVEVIVQNDATERAGSVRVAFGGLSGEKAVATHDLVLPPNARKRVFLYVPTPKSGASTLSVQFGRPGRWRVARFSESINSVAESQRLIGVVGPSSGVLPPSDDLDVAEYRVVYLSPDQIADRHEGLEMLDALFFSPPPERPLSSIQVTAIRDWVLRGGLLLVDASKRTDAMTSGSFPALLPFMPSGTRQAHLERFGQEVFFADGSVTSGATLIESDGHPLVVQRGLGLGAVVAFAMDPSLPAFARWDGRNALWNGLLRGLGAKKDAIGGNDTAGPIGDDVEVDRIRSLVGSYSSPQAVLTAMVEGEQRGVLRLGIVLLLTVLYALAVGPGDFFLVRKLGKPKLTWITFPIIVAVFTVVAYGGAKAAVGGEMAAIYRERLIIVPEEEVAVRHRLTGLFVPQSARYTLGYAEGAIPREITTGFDFEQVVGTTDVSEGTYTHTVPIWKRRVYAASDMTSRYPQISLHVEGKGDAREAVIVNGTSRPLRGAYLVYGRWGFRTHFDTIGAETSERISLREGIGPVAVDSTTMLGRFEGGWGALPSLREFNATAALERGAALLIIPTFDEPDCPLVVNESPRNEPGNREIVVVAYSNEKDES